MTATDASLDDILAQNPLVVAKFYADWCGTCRLIAPKYKSLANDPQFAGVVFLDIHAELNPQARQRVGVNNLPFFATFRNGQVVEADCTGKEETVRQMLERLQQG